MPREKKPHLKKRADGRYRCRYKGIEFYSSISAEDALSQREEYKRNEQVGMTRQATVSEYALPWLQRSFPTVADSTYTGLAIHLQHLIDEIGNRRISTIVPSDIKGVYSKQYVGCSVSYLKAARQLFSSLFDAAVADGLIRSNPARDKTAKPHKGKVGKHRPITAQEREWIETYCHDHRAFPAVITMLYAGIRPQEAKALRIESSLDEKDGVLHITETAHRDGNNQYKITETMKTEKSRRDVPLMPPVQEALQGREGLLITSAKGKQVTSTTWRNAFSSYKVCMEREINGIDKRWYGKTKEQKKLAEEGKLPPWVEFTPVPYDYRVSFCTWGRDHGVELHTMIEWMGHSDAKMIMKIYDEVSDQRSKSQAEMLKKAAFEGQSGGQNKK